MSPNPPDQIERTQRSIAKGRPLAVGLALAMIGLFTVWFASPASADQFDPPNSTPAIGVTTDTLAMAPDTGASNTVYMIETNVSEADTLMDVNTVTWCVYLITQATGSPPGDVSACATPDPKTNVKFTWTRSTDAFTIDNGSGTFWALGTAGDVSVSNYVSTNTSMDVDLKFTVSEASRAGTWGVKAIVDDGDTTANHSDTIGYTMAYYSNIQTQRASQNFGTLTAGSADADNVAATVVANGSSDLLYQLGGNFVDGSANVATVATGTAGTGPTPGQVSYDCSPTGTYDLNTDVRVVTASPTMIASAVHPDGTVENGTASAAQSCRLTSGGALPRAGSPYVSTVTVSVGPTP